MNQNQWIFVFIFFFIFSSCTSTTTESEDDDDEEEGVSSGITVSPSSLRLSLCKESTFMAEDETTSESITVDWLVDDVGGGSASLGTITSGGVYAAPDEIPEGGSVTVKATSQEDSSLFGTSIVTLQTVILDDLRTVTTASETGASGESLNDSSENLTPQMIAMAGDALCTVWTDDQDGSNDIWSACSPTATGTFGDTVRVNSTTSGDQDAPSMATDTDGNIYVTWCGAETSDSALRFSSSADGGATFTTEVSVNENSGFNVNATCGHSVAVVANGAIYVAVAGINTNVTGNSNIGLFCSNDGGVTFTFVTGKINQAPNDGNNSISTQYPAVAVDSDNNLHVAWYDSRNGERDVFYDKGTIGSSGCADLSFTDSDFRVNRNRADENENDVLPKPALMTGSDGRVHVAWAQENPENGNDLIYYSQKGSGDDAFSDAVQVDSEAPSSNFNQSQPDIGMDSSGLIYVSWQDNRSGSSKPYVAKSCDDGASFTTPGNLNTENGEEIDTRTVNPSFIVDNSDQVHFSWNNETDDTIEVRTAESVED